MSLPNARRLDRAAVAATALASLLLIAAGPPAAAQEKIDKRLPAAADGTVEVDNVSGSVQVTGWDGAEIQVTGTLGRGTERLDFTVEGRHARVKVVLPRRARDVEDTDLLIRVPRASHLEVETVSAEIGVDEVTGDLDLHSVSGGVTVGGHPAGADAQTVSGAIRIAGPVPRIHAESVSGDVVLEGVRDEVEISTVSGRASVTGDRVDRLRFESVSGDLDCAVAPTAAGSLELKSHSGTIELRLPAKTDADFRISTFSGEIESDFGGRPQRTGHHGPGHELVFTAGSGGASVDIDTFSGDVKLRTR